MKRLSHGLKKVLSGLAHQYASEFLSRREKMQVLCNEPETWDKTSVAPKTN